MCLALVAVGALETARNSEQRRMHIEVVLAGEFSRLGRETVAARITPKPEAIAEALYVGKVNLAPGIAIWLCVPHTSIPTLEALS
ncbi:MAG: hypothetical protein V3R34_00470 [Hyphomicrobium sp.]